MHPDLMGTSRLQLQVHQRVAILATLPPKMGDCTLSMFKIYTPFNSRPLLTGDGGIDHTGFRQKAGGYSKILPMNFSPDNHLRQKRTAIHMLCNDQKPRGITIQPVDTSVDKGDPLILIVPGHGICKGIVVIVNGWVDGRVSSFIYNKKILILIDDMEGKRNRKDPFRGSFFY
jgi:hypothetical protein